MQGALRKSDFPGVVRHKRARKEARVPVFEMGSTIPKVVYQVYTGDLPPVLAQNGKDLKALNPGWTYRFFDGAAMEEFVRSSYGELILDYYRRINPKYGAVQVDFFRYLLIYKNGGVYLDMKSSVDRPLDEVVRSDDKYLLSTWPQEEDNFYYGWGRHGALKDLGGEEFQQWHIIAVAGHPFLKAVIESVMRAIDCYDPWANGVGKHGVMHLAGPVAYTLAIAPLLDRYPRRLIENHEDAGLIYTIFGKNFDHTHCKLFKRHYTSLTDPLLRLPLSKWIHWVTHKLYLGQRRLAGRIVRALLKRLSPST